MNRKSVKLFFTICISICILSSAVMARTYNLNDELKDSLNGLTLAQGSEKVLNVLESHGYDESVNGKITLHEGSNGPYKWDSVLQLRKESGPEPIKIMESGQITGYRYKIEIHYNGVNKGTYDISVGITPRDWLDGVKDALDLLLNNEVKSEVDSGLTDKINEVLQEQIGISNALTDNDINSEDFNNGALVEKRTPETAYITIQSDANGKITSSSTELETDDSNEFDKITDAGKGSKPRPDWYTKKLQPLTGGQLTNPVDNPDAYDPGEISEYDEVFNIANIIIGIVKYVGIALSVIMLMLLGIKYLTGSIEEKAEYKKTMIPYLIGILLLFAGSTLVSIIYNFAVKL